MSRIYALKLQQHSLILFELCNELYIWIFFKKMIFQLEKIAVTQN